MLWSGELGDARRRGGKVMLSQTGYWTTAVCPTGACVRPARRAWRALAAGFAAGAVVAAAVAYAAPALPPLPLRSVRPTALEQSFPVRELPREWRWAPQSVSVEHMFRGER
jgi:hypothetical protein